MGNVGPTLRDLMLRLRETFNLINQHNEQLKNPGLSYGKRQSILKTRQLQLSKAKSMALRIDRMANGNIITITFRCDNKTYRKIYTNISLKDAEAHLKLVYQMNGVSIEILESKEVQTRNSLTEL